MSDPQQVVVRLLAAIDEREREYNRCAEELREAARAKVRLPHTEFLRATVSDGLRLCQAHRDIVAEHSPREIASLEHDTWGQTFTVCRTCCVDGRRVVFPCPTLKITARGYGVEDGETK